MPNPEASPEKPPPAALIDFDNESVEVLAVLASLLATFKTALNPPISSFALDTPFTAATIEPIPAAATVPLGPIVSITFARDLNTADSPFTATLSVPLNASDFTTFFKEEIISFKAGSTSWNSSLATASHSCFKSATCPE